MDPQQPQTGSGAGGAPHDAAADIQANRDIAALSYVWILSLVVYFSKKDSPFTQFHAKQGIVLFLLSVIVWFIPVAGRLLELVVLALAVLGFLAAAQGQWKELPLIGPLARRDWKGVRASWRDILDAFVRGWKEVKKNVSPKHAAPGPPPSAASAKPAFSPAVPVAPQAIPPVDSSRPAPPPAHP